MANTTFVLSYLTAKQRKILKNARLLNRYHCFSNTLLNVYLSNNCAKSLKI